VPVCARSMAPNITSKRSQNSNFMGNHRRPELIAAVRPAAGAGTDRTHWRCRYVMDENETRKKLRACRVLKDNDARIACLIVQSFRLMIDMIDKQSPAVIEALLDFAEDMQEPDIPARKDRSAVKAALIQYVEHALRVSRAREHRSFNVINRECSSDEKTGIRPQASPHFVRRPGRAVEGD
jgi:hypothetical protein